MKRIRSTVVASVATFATLATMLAVVVTAFAATAGAHDAGMEVLHGAHIMKVNDASPRPKASTANDLYYHGGVGGYGVETGRDKVYLIYWGSQWNSNDPSGEATIQKNFFNGVGGSKWNNSVTQYCQGVATGTYTCATTC